MQITAYPGGEAQKASVIAEMEAHALADRLVQGHGYWEGGKGCAVGCLIKSGNHAEYEPRFGIPQALARLEDIIFENLTTEEARAWPVRFLSTPQVGADLALVQWRFLAFVVGEALSHPEASSVREACQPALDVVEAMARGEAVSESAARSAARSARSAARSAWSAAESAASAASAASAWSAAESAASAWSAARSAARSAESAAWSAESAWSAARSAAWSRYAAKLIELMAAAPVLAKA